MSNSLCQFWDNKSISLQIFISLQFHERLFLWSFLAQTVYTLLKRSPLKWTFLRLSSALVKIYQIFYVNFKVTSRLLSKFCIPRQFDERLFLCTFLAQTTYTVLKRSPLKFFETFECSGEILSNSLCQFWNDESIPLQILYPSSVSWKITPLYFFSSNNIYTLLKRSPLQWKFWRLMSAQVKICHISYVSFEMTSQFLFKFCIILHCQDTQLICGF